jgi:hypothetical protein
MVTRAPITTWNGPSVCSMSDTTLSRRQRSVTALTRSLETAEKAAASFWSANFASLTAAPRASS